MSLCRDSNLDFLSILFYAECNVCLLYTSVICYASRKNHRDLAGGPLYVYYTFYLSELLHENLYLVPASDIEKYLDCSDALLAGLGLDTTCLLYTSRCV